MKDNILDQHLIPDMDTLEIRIKRKKRQKDLVFTFRGFGQQMFTHCGNYMYTLGLRIDYENSGSDGVFFNLGLVLQWTVHMRRTNTTEWKEYNVSKFRVEITNTRKELTE